MLKWKLLAALGLASGFAGVTWGFAQPSEPGFYSEFPVLGENHADRPSHAHGSVPGISDLPALDGPFIHPKAAQRPKLLFVTASSRFRGRQLSPW